MNSAPSPLPKNNVHWRQLLQRVNRGETVQIEERRSVFVAYRGGMPDAVVNWSSFDAKKAQRWLRSRAFARCCHADCDIRVARLGQSCGNHETDQTGETDRPQRHPPSANPQPQVQPQVHLPSQLTEQQGRDEIASLRADIDAELARGEAEGQPCPQMLLQLFDCGHWLHHRMAADGASEQQCNSASFALGQRTMMSGLSSCYKLAAQSYNRFVAGRADVGGAALARKLLRDV